MLVENWVVHQHNVRLDFHEVERLFFNPRQLGRQFDPSFPHVPPDTDCKSVLIIPEGHLPFRDHRQTLVGYLLQQLVQLVLMPLLHFVPSTISNKAAAQLTLANCLIRVTSLVRASQSNNTMLRSWLTHSEGRGGGRAQQPVA